MTDSILSTCTAAQRVRLLDRLREVANRGITTIEAREELDIMHPAARVQELRQRLQVNIQTVWTRDINAQGHAHKTARYVLFPGKYEESKV